MITSDRVSAPIKKNLLLTGTVKHYYKGCISFSQPLRTSVIPPASFPTIALAPFPCSTTQEILVLARPRKNPALRANQTPLREGKTPRLNFIP